MGELSAKERNKLKSDDFAFVDRDGERHLPIHDEEHVRNAMSRWNQTKFDSAADKEAARKKIVRAAKAFGIDVSPDDKIATPAT